MLVDPWHHGAMPKRSSPKRDFMEVARGIVEHAIGEQMDGNPLETPPPDTRNPHAVALGSMGGRKGGCALCCLRPNPPPSGSTKELS